MCRSAPSHELVALEVTVEHLRSGRLRRLLVCASISSALFVGATHIKQLPTPELVFMYQPGVDAGDCGPYPCSGSITGSGDEQYASRDVWFYDSQVSLSSEDGSLTGVCSADGNEVVPYLASANDFPATQGRFNQAVDAVLLGLGTQAAQNAIQTVARAGAEATAEYLQTANMLAPSSNYTLAANRGLGFLASEAGSYFLAGMTAL